MLHVLMRALIMALHCASVAVALSRIIWRKMSLAQ